MSQAPSISSVCPDQYRENIQYNTIYTIYNIQYNTIYTIYNIQYNISQAGFYVSTSRDMLKSPFWLFFAVYLIICYRLGELEVKSMF